MLNAQTMQMEGTTLLLGWKAQRLIEPKTFVPLDAYKATSEEFYKWIYIVNVQCILWLYIAIKY